MQGVILVKSIDSGADYLDSKPRSTPYLLAG